MMVKGRLCRVIRSASSGPSSRMTTNAPQSSLRRIVMRRDIRRRVSIWGDSSVSAKFRTVKVCYYGGCIMQK
jgi:hypothetical protein